jgi:hypothetical protein
MDSLEDKVRAAISSQTEGNYTVEQLLDLGRTFGTALDEHDLRLYQLIRGNTLALIEIARHLDEKRSDAS